MGREVGKEKQVQLTVNLGETGMKGVWELFFYSCNFSCKFEINF